MSSNISSWVCVQDSLFKIKKVHLKVIEFRHTTFLKRRELIDRVLIANETFDEIKSKKSIQVFLKGGL